MIHVMKETRRPLGVKSGALKQTLRVLQKSVAGAFCLPVAGALVICRTMCFERDSFVQLLYSDRARTSDDTSTMSQRNSVCKKIVRRRRYVCAQIALLLLFTYITALKSFKNNSLRTDRSLHQRDNFKGLMQRNFRFWVIAWLRICMFLRTFWYKDDHSIRNIS